MMGGIYFHITEVNMNKGKGKSKGCCGSCKRTVLAFLSIIMLLVIAFSSYALECGFQSPSSSGYLTSGGIVNVSISNQGTTEPVITVNVSATSPSTSNSSVGLLWTYANRTGTMGRDSVNGSLLPISTFIIEPSSDYTLACVCSNSTATVSCNSTRTGVTIDRGDVPETPTITSPSVTTDTAQTQVFTASVNAANTSQCLLTFQGTNPGHSTFGMTHSDNTCTITLTGIAPETYKYYIRASDGLNYTDTALTTITITKTASGVAQRIAAISGGGATPTKQDIGAKLAVLSNDGSSSGGAALDPTVTAVGIGAVGGALVGLALGSMVLPIIGSVSGVVVGAVIGALAGYGYIAFG
jgi:hypothetical protein